MSSFKNNDFYAQPPAAATTPTARAAATAGAAGLRPTAGYPPSARPATPSPASQIGQAAGATTATAITNYVLSSLGEDELARLRPSMEMVWLRCREDLTKVNSDGFVYFPESAVVSQLSLLNDGGMAEVALIGHEGLIGLGLILNEQAAEPWARVALAGRALRVRADEVKREFQRGGSLQRALLHYAGEYISQIARRAICNNQHKTEERLASWLLMMHDRAAIDVLPLTQEQIARRLGTRRASITLAALALQQQNIIGYHRGRIRILDRLALERAACECYLPIGRIAVPGGSGQIAPVIPTMTAHA